MDGHSPDEDEQSKKELLSRFTHDDTPCSEAQPKNRRGILKGITLSVLSTLGLSQTTTTVAATQDESVDISENKARKVIKEYRSRLGHLAKHGILNGVDIDSLVTNVTSESSNEREVQAKVIRGPEGDTEPAIRVETRGPKGKVEMWFPLNSDYALFDLPDNVNSELLNKSWNNQVSSQGDSGDDNISTSSCPDCNDGCCCNVCSCDNCHCTYWGYCDCTHVAGTDCWYKHCDCCSDAVNYCTRYCGTPLSSNC